MATYLDHNSTTPVLPETLEQLMPWFSESFGNSSSATHQYGRQAAKAIESAREELAHLIGASSLAELYFNSGATEGLNTALIGIFKAYAHKGKHIVSVKTEHNAVLDTLSYLESEGAEVQLLDVGKDGVVNLVDLQNAIRTDTILVCVMLANNETGVIADMAAISTIVHLNGSIMVCDGTQAVGKIPVNVNKFGIDVMVFSGHKFYAMKGVGGLFVRRKNPRVTIPPLLHGGGHESGMRSGTLNVPGILSMQYSLSRIVANMHLEMQRQQIMRAVLENGLLKLGAHIVAKNSMRLPNTTMVIFSTIKAEKLISRLPNFAFSTGSACTSALPQPSHVLLAMGYSKEEAEGAIRISFGKNTSLNDIKEFLNSLEASLLLDFSQKQNIISSNL